MTDDGESEVREAAGADFDPGLRPLLDRLSATHNFDFREYKEPSLARRIRARMSQVRIDSFDTYSRYLDQHAEEHVTLFNTILINVTDFFRDPEAWKILAADLIPRIVKAAGESRAIRIWSAGCSSGEEPYSIAMLLAEHLGDRAADYVVKIYATDVDEDALAAARHAVYRLEQLKDLPDTLVDKYFARDGQLYRVRRDLRRWCIFGAHNLTQAPPLSHIDLLVCRNVLIYFTSELQERVLSRFHYAVREDGFLFLGRSESLLARSRLFRPVHLKWRMFERTPAMARQVAAVLPDRDDARAHAGSSTHETGARSEQPTGLRSQRALEALPAAVIVIDPADTILAWNLAAETLFDVPIASAVARKFRDLDVSYRVEGLRTRIEEVKTRHSPARMDNVVFARRTGEPVHADVWIQPLLEAYRFIGVLVFAMEASEHARLKEQMSRIAEQHATAIEELQSTNEELETTNEELQSTNEELETTNEELQSTNEELETTVEELQATNTELAALNAELEGRTDERNRLDTFHRSLLNSLDDGIVVLDRDAQVTSWNQTAERLLALRAEHAVGRQFFALPIGQVGEQARAPFDAMRRSGDAVEATDVAYGIPGGTSQRGTIRVQPLRSASGEILGAVVTMRPLPGATKR
jgi:two-component system, chemotaxis family, CheB/CheR fusion protein